MGRSCSGGGGRTPLFEGAGPKHAMGFHAQFVASESKEIPDDPMNRKGTDSRGRCLRSFLSPDSVDIELKLTMPSNFR